MKEPLPRIEMATAFALPSDPTERAHALKTLARALRSSSPPPLPPSSSLAPLIGAVASDVHAAIAVHCLVKMDAPLLARAGAIAPLCRAAAPTAPTKLRGWAVGALAHFSKHAALRSQLLVCIPVLLRAISPDAAADCNAWAGEALAQLCRAGPACAQCLKQGAMPLLLAQLRVHADAVGGAPLPADEDASAAAVRSVLNALRALCTVAPGRALLAAKDGGGIGSLVALLRSPVAGSAAAALLTQLLEGNAAVAWRVLGAKPMLAAVRDLVRDIETQLLADAQVLEQSETARRRRHDVDVPSPR